MLLWELNHSGRVRSLIRQHNMLLLAWGEHFRWLDQGRLLTMLLSVLARCGPLFADRAASRIAVDVCSLTMALLQLLRTWAKLLHKILELRRHLVLFVKVKGVARLHLRKHPAPLRNRREPSAISEPRVVVYYHS